MARGASSAPRTLSELTAPGSLFGELGVFTGKRTISAQVVQDATVQVVPLSKETAEKAVVASPELGLTLARTIAARLRESADELRKELELLSRVKVAVDGFCRRFTQTAKALAEKAAGAPEARAVAEWAAQTASFSRGDLAIKKERGTTRALQAEVAGSGERMTSFADGATICREGEVGDRMFIIIDGAVDVFVGGELVETAIKGQIVGEMAVLLREHQKRNATLKAKGATQLGVIPADRLDQVMKARPKLALHLGAFLSDRLLNSNRLLVEKTTALEQALGPLVKGETALVAEAKTLAQKVGALGDACAEPRAAAEALAAEADAEAHKLLAEARALTQDDTILSETPAAPTATADASEPAPAAATAEAGAPAPDQTPAGKEGDPAAPPADAAAGGKEQPTTKGRKQTAKKEKAKPAAKKKG